MTITITLREEEVVLFGKKHERPVSNEKAIAGLKKAATLMEADSARLREKWLSFALDCARGVR